MSLSAHLAGGDSTVARAWSILRRDGVALAFTDHDGPLEFEGLRFVPTSGLTARALSQGTGLAVDNSEVLGVLTDAAIREADIEAGRLDGARVEMWLVNWADTSQRSLRFAGTIGEIRRGAGGFHAELRGQTEALNQPRGRVFQRGCGAVLGDGACRFNLTQAGYFADVAAGTAERGQVFRFPGLETFAERWFERGRIEILTGEGAGLSGVIKHDRTDGTLRVIELWEPLRATLSPTDLLRLTAGCDKRAATCRFKFGNILNFQGFPFIPGEDWLISVPRPGGANGGGSLRS